MGNGFVCFAEQSVESGIAAVAVSSMPLFAALFSGLYGEWPQRREILGLAIGFAGVIVLNLGSGLSGSPLGALMLIVAAAAWAFGSVWSKRQDMPKGPMNTAAQMLCGGVALAVLSLLAGERVPTDPGLSSNLAIVYLAVFGSIVAFSAYLYLLKTVRPALATSYAYVNPPVAVLFGVMLAGEHIGPLDLVGMVVILVGVAIVILARSRE
jgi:drug/metabolite transporter (DMT)-like permease